MMGRPRAGDPVMGRRSITVLVLSVFALAVLTGCTGDSDRRQHGWATVRFDGTALGEWARTDAYPRIWCNRESDTGPASLIERRDRWCCGNVRGDSVPRGGGAGASLRLEMDPGRARSASVEFSIDGAVYRSDTATKVEPGWRGGRAVFRDVPLVSGEAYEGKPSLRRLVIEWRCAQPD